MGNQIPNDIVGRNDYLSMSYIPVFDAEILMYWHSLSKQQGLLVQLFTQYQSNISLKFHTYVIRVLSFSPLLGLIFDLGYNTLWGFELLNLYATDRHRVGTIIARSNMTWYCIKYKRDWGRTPIRVCPHKRHPAARPNGRAIGCLLWEFWRKLTGW